MKNKKNVANGGFSLVELIVVIAIMSILISVGAVVYTSYIEKAQETADKQTIADIENALMLGANSQAITPGSVVGIVAIGKNGAECSTNAALGSDVIDEMMDAAFGDDWRKTLKIQSDLFSDTDFSKILSVVQGGGNYFDSVSDSSYYGNNDSAAGLAADVDQLASALSSVLDGMGSAVNVQSLWGDNFTANFNANNIDYSANSQLAANLTVFAAANAISGASEADKLVMINNWATGSENATSETALVMQLSMNFAKCTAVKNYVANNPSYKDRDRGDVNDQYDILMREMQKLETAGSGAYVKKFNDAINQFWDSINQYKDDWQSSGRAETDAKAFIASMAAVNTLEDSYVSADRVDVLDDSEFYTNNGAADVLNSMVQYSQMDLSNLPQGTYEYIVTLAIDANGNPYVAPKLERG